MVETVAIVSVKEGTEASIEDAWKHWCSVSGNIGFLKATKGATCTQREKINFSIFSHRFFLNLSCWLFFYVY